MAYLRHDSGGPATLKNRQALGDDSPLEFDDDGYAGPFDDETAIRVSAMNRHVDAVETRPDSGGSDSDDADTCQEVLTSGDREGEICGRDRPCRFHD